ncbi:uncharacterized protein LOC115428747 isoform X2 [Sphaeramia orbicularis]|uniref:uncharacterized protein LOC115428747 isoform X2 n=1 Tax=Sphaeramia orbicularis TaxID=375764 RepID=UPI00117EBEAC|nr:uncharacterized protein LOC115428747 isoform X2 [Sphaeramia orbicularis]
MIRFLCCCCISSENSGNERQPLLQPQPSEVNGAESARQTRSQNGTGTGRRTGRLVMRRVGVPELDQRFLDVAEAFNEQQHRYETMVRLISNLQQRCGCVHSGALALAECMRKIRDEHGSKYRVTLRLKGYDFFLCVVPVESENTSDESEPLPSHLQMAVDELKNTSECAKATISKGTSLQELIGWLLRSKDQMADQVKAAVQTYQEQQRLDENLKENMKEVTRAKELSLEYRRRAGDVLTEAAQIAGALL